MKLDYEIIHANRKTIGITVERDRRVVVRAPRHMSEQAVSAAVRKQTVLDLAETA